MTEDPPQTMGVVETLEECVRELPERQCLVGDLHERAYKLRCQVKIMTRPSFQLHLTNYSARDVYVRLLGHGNRVSGTGLLALKESVHLSPLKLSVISQQEVGKEVAEQGARDAPPSEERSLNEEKRRHDEEEEEGSGALTISELAYSPCASLLPTPMEDVDGVDLLFESPVQLLKELHTDCEPREELEAEQKCKGSRQERAMDSRWLLGRDYGLPVGNKQLNACLRSLLRLLAMALGLLLVLLPLLLVLLESDIDVSFLREIRQTPEFEQFHYEYYCPLRRWIMCKLNVILDNLGGE